MDKIALKNVLEAALLAAGKPLSLEDLGNLFGEDERPDANAMREALAVLGAEYEGRGIELREVASGYRIQIRQAMATWITRLWEERPGRYSRALMETLALVAYRQPITRGEIEDIRGVSVSTAIVKTLLDRDWVRVVGHRDVPGKPAMYGTTRQFLDYFGLRSLDELPTLSELREIDSLNVELDLGPPVAGAAADDLAEDEALDEGTEAAGESAVDELAGDGDDADGQTIA